MALLPPIPALSEKRALNGFEPPTYLPNSVKWLMKHISGHCIDLQMECFL
jgi:hypothetical protein